MLGKLYIVSTPIGNLKDITFRSINILKDVDAIACEDTRITNRLLNKYDIVKKLVVYNDYNERNKTNTLIDFLLEGKKIALVSDAGTPCISDPGYRLVNAAQKNNIEVLSIPGPSSVQAALSISGLPTDNYFFQGFLPKKKGRETKFNELKNIKCSIVLFESPKRVNKTLLHIEKYLGNRIISICKEITKVHEKVFIGRVHDIINNIKEITLKGEFVIVIAKERYEL